MRRNPLHVARRPQAVMQYECPRGRVAQRTRMRTVKLTVETDRLPSGMARRNADSAARVKSACVKHGGITMIYCAGVAAMATQT